MTSDDDSRDSTTNAIRIKLIDSTTAVVLSDFCRKWSTSVCMSESTVEAIKKLGELMNETARKIKEATRNARRTSPDGMIDVSKYAEGFNPWEPHSIRKPAWIDARSRRPPIPERRPLAVRKWQARQAAKRKAGNVNRRRARRK